MTAFDSFLANQALFFGLSYLWFFTFGCIVRYAGMRVNYARKLVGFLFAFSILFSDWMFPYSLPYGNLITIVLLLVFFLSMSDVMRINNKFLDICHAAVDRPEDYPYTIKWIIAEYVLSYFVISASVDAFALFHIPNFIFMNLLIVLFADGLAEPVGIKFGKHHYSTYSIFGNKRKYTRSLEGSACVFLVSMLVVIAFMGYFSPLQLLVALVSIPLTVMLAEAFSPHTCDAPLIYTVCTINLIAIGYVH